MRLVVIESPYAGDREKNVRYAKACMLDSLKRGEAPYASHLLYTQVLEDSVLEERLQGMYAGFAWGVKADLVAVYTDLGTSEGMKAGIERAINFGQIVVYRQLNWCEEKSINLQQKLTNLGNEELDQ
jgi:hypothetical protein